MTPASLKAATALQARGARNNAWHKRQMAIRPRRSFGKLAELVDTSHALYIIMLCIHAHRIWYLYIYIFNTKRIACRLDAAATETRSRIILYVYISTAKVRSKFVEIFSEGSVDLARHIVQCAYLCDACSARHIIYSRATLKNRRVGWWLSGPARLYIPAERHVFDTHTHDPLYNTPIDTHTVLQLTRVRRRTRLDSSHRVYAAYYIPLNRRHLNDITRFIFIYIWLEFVWFNGLYNIFVWVQFLQIII